MSDFNDYERYNNSTGNRANADYPNNSRNSFYNDEVVSIGTWILVLIATAIPFVNLIVLFALAFGASSQNLKNYGKAALIIAGIGLLLSIMIGGCMRI